jgi:cell division transport system permease protein
MSFAAVGVIVACLLIMGSFALLAFNLDAIIKDIQNNNEILVVLDEGLSREEFVRFGTTLSGRTDIMDNIAEYTPISKDQALADFAEKVDEEYRYLIEGFATDNPLRDRYVVKLIDVNQMQDTVLKLEALNGVAQVYARLDIAQNLVRLRNAMNTISLLLILILLAVSAFIISNTVKLATFDRREEIGIMRVVGATKSFVRWPFVIEGFLLGLIGSIIAFFLQWRVYALLTERISEGLSGIALIKTVSFGEILAPVLGIFLLAGFLVGVGGSVLTIRKFLRV